MKNQLMLVTLASVVFFISSCSQKKSNKMKDEKLKTNDAILVADMNTDLKPGNDFYLYSNGGWIKSHPVPGDKTQYGSFTVLFDNNQKELKELVLNLAKQKNKENSEAQKIGDFYNSGMDSVRINNDGFKPIVGDLAQIDKIKTTDDLIKQIAIMHAEGYSGMFNFGNVQDEKNSENEIAFLGQGGLGLPDRDYYLSDDDRIKQIKQKYTEFITNSFILIGLDKKIANENAKKILNIETKLAENSFTRLELRDPFKNYNKMTLDQLKKLSPDFDWTLYFNTINLKSTSEINVMQTKFFKNLSDLIKNISIDDWKIYLKWKIINSASSYLSDDFVNENFKFYGTILSGQKEITPRWKRVLNNTNMALGQPVGKLYVEKYFPAEAKKRMLTLVENLKTSFKNRISKLDWMTDTTKQKAIEKLQAINVKIGYPDKWEDFTNLSINKENSYYENIKSAREFLFKKDLAKIGKKHDKNEWELTPQTVNAYYSPNSNEIVFPAAILQPPFFYMDADDAVNYGAIGVVIGHEMTHGFDDQGKNYDKFGNLNNWWQNTDSKAFKEKTKLIVEQFNNHKELDSLHVNGELTLGENIADLGGLNISWDAFKTTNQAKENDTISGFTANQRFFLSYAKVWRQNILNEELMRRLKLDVHSPGDARVNVPLFNLDEFYKAFNITEGDKLYRKPNDRAKIW